MSYCREEGKDKLIFATEEDHSTPSNIILLDDDDENEGLIKPSGEINWDCPCLQGMADGPCGEQFKSAFSCFHYSEAETKGADCVPQFQEMQICFSKYPEIYGKEDDESSENEERSRENEIAEITEKASTSKVQSNTQNDEEFKSTEKETTSPEGGSEGQIIKVSPGS